MPAVEARLEGGVLADAIQMIELNTDGNPPPTITYPQADAIFIGSSDTAAAPVIHHYHRADSGEDNELVYRFTQTTTGWRPASPRGAALGGRW